jgi:hypothetical protein
MKHPLFALILAACTGCDGCSTIHHSDNFLTEYCGDVNPEIEKLFNDKSPKWKRGHLASLSSDAKLKAIVTKRWWRAKPIIPGLIRMKQTELSLLSR